MSMWHESIPKNIQHEIGEAVLNQLDKLPNKLRVEWMRPAYLEREWFIEAAQHITIPHMEYLREES